MQNFFYDDHRKPKLLWSVEYLLVKCIKSIGTKDRKDREDKENKEDRENKENGKDRKDGKNGENGENRKNREDKEERDRKTLNGKKDGLMESKRTKISSNEVDFLEDLLIRIFK